VGGKPADPSDQKGGAPEPTYEGIPLSQLPIHEIDWEHRAEHIRTRTKRYPDKPEFDIEPEWATEACLDSKRLIATTTKPDGTPGMSIEVIGWSPSAPGKEAVAGGRVLKVWIVPKDPKDLSAGSWWGTSACDGNEDDRNAYGGQK
jgi:hypothetical protein